MAENKQNSFTLFSRISIGVVLPLLAFGRLDVRRESPYINIKGNEGLLTISKGNPDNLYITKPGFSLLYNKKKKLSILETRKNGHFYTVAVKGSQVGVLVQTLDKQFDINAMDCSLRSDSSALDLNVKSKIEAIALASSIDSSCEEKLDTIDFRQLTGSVANLMNKDTSYLSKCLTSEEFKTRTKTNPDLQQLSLKIANAFANDDQIGNGLKISCEEGAGRASYDPNQDLISLPTSEGSVGVNKCKNLDMVLAHEFVHRVGPTVNENLVGQIDRICAEFSGSTTVNDKDCQSEFPKLSNTQGVLVQAEIANTQKAENEIVREQVESQLNESINTAAFVPVQDADIKEITQPTSRASYDQSVNRVYSAMSTNLERMAEPLNRAIAATTNTAQATTDSSSRSSTSKSRQRSRLPASKSSNKEYVVEEILADKYDIPVEQVRRMSAQIPRQNVSAAVNDTAPAVPETAASGSSSPTQKKDSASRRGPASASTTPAESRSGVASSSGASGAGVSSGLTASGNKSAQANRNIRRGPSSATLNPANTADRTLQNLRYFSEVRGERYQQIRDRYNDPQFVNELRSQNIAIEYRDRNKVTIIGESSSGRVLFRDDGTALKKISGAR